MSTTPRFSVTVPAYNATATLAETVASVQAQTFPYWELVIVDDGSTDGTLALARDLAAQDDRIHVFTQENRGTGGAYNTAVRNARAPYLVLLASDDLLLPNHLEEYDRAITEHQDASIFSSGGYFEYEDGTRVLSVSNKRWPDPSSCTIEELLKECFFGIGAVYSRELFDTVGGFMERVYAEDYPYWLFAMAHGFKHHYLDQPLSVHRRNSVQKSSDALEMRKADLIAVRRLVDSGLLSGRPLRLAKGAVRHYRFVVAVRTLLSRTIGADRSNRLIDRLKGRKPVGTKRETHA